MTKQEALRLADALDDEFVQARISNYTGRKAAVELRRLHEANQELLEALQEVVAAADGTGWDQLDPSFKKQRAAIAKHGNAT